MGKSLGFDMKKILLTLIAVAAMAGSASAADLAARPYVKAPMPAPVASWTGFYIGGDVGGAWARTSVANNFLPNSAKFGADNEVFNNSASSVTGSIHAGYNWQVSPQAVVGIEADWTGLKANSSATTIWTAGGAASCTFIPAASCFTTISTNLSWLATVRGRAGVLVAPNVLLYATGGVAWGKRDYFGEGSNSTDYDAVFRGSSSSNTGYVVGAGAEWMAAANWIVRAEYLHYSLGKGPNVSVFPAGFPTFGNNFSWDRTNINTVRVGLSYKFGGPVVAKY